MIQNEICMQIRDFCSYLTPQGDLETWLVCYERFMCTRLKMCLILPPNIFFFPLKVAVLWYAAPFSLLRIDRRFRHAYWLRHQTDKLLWNVGRCQTAQIEDRHLVNVFWEREQIHYQWSYLFFIADTQFESNQVRYISREEILKQGLFVCAGKTMVTDNS